VTATSREVRTHRVSRSGNLDPGEQLLYWGTHELLNSPATGSLFADHAQARCFEIGPDYQPGSSYAELPWGAQTAMPGPVWARLGAGAVLEAYRAGPPIPPVPRARVGRRLRRFESGLRSPPAACSAVLHECPQGSEAVAGRPRH
jgi:hypothetical protein